MPSGEDIRSLVEALADLDGVERHAARVQLKKSAQPRCRL
jgi:hypothetical protein